MYYRRLHITRTDAIRTLPTGGIEVDAVLCRAGVFAYQTEAGETVREFRSPSLLQSPNVVESLKGATVTVQHPRELRVTPDNYRRETVGTVVDAQYVDGKIVGKIHIQDAAAIEAVLRGDLIEISPGYDVALDETPGTDPQFGAFDSGTKALVFHHVSLLPAGEGRQGPDVALRLDSSGHCIVDSSRGDNASMDPDQLKAMIAEMMPDFEALQSQVADRAMESLKEMLPAMIAEAVAGAKSEEPEPKSDEEDEEPKSDAEDEPLSERLDSTDLDALVEYVRVTGERPDTSLSRRALLAAAAESAGLTVRADASTERLLGALEGRPAKSSGWHRKGPEAVKDDFVSAQDYNRRIIARMAEGK